ncbi:translation factor GTPase family protein [Chryseobacterium elymi]|uniref:hypothetical protein n=1 Tax=Chryseobacterium elymi TaxID=395936 RepID=UPI001EE8F58E|nr:hypothetical protein [Chryseobacterium elymi]
MTYFSVLRNFYEFSPTFLLIAVRLNHLFKFADQKFSKKFWTIKKGFREAMENGPLKGYPLEGMKIRLLDGSFHNQDSAAFDFENAARDGFRAVALSCSPKLLEPVMQVEIQSIEEYTGAVTADINRRRGIISSIDERSGRKIFMAEIPLASTFGYISDLRTLTSGRASISMKLSHYALVPDFIANTLVT